MTILAGYAMYMFLFGGLVLTALCVALSYRAGTLPPK